MTKPTTAHPYARNPTGIVGVLRPSAGYDRVFKPWLACAMNKSCIFPPRGGGVDVKRGDQEAMTMLMHSRGSPSKTCTSGPLKHGIAQRSVTRSISVNIGQYWSMVVNIGQYRSISVNIGQYRSIVVNSGQ